MLSVFLSGLVSGLALIVAIGAQNAFVLRAGIRRSHVGLIVTICILSDAILIICGVAGIGALITAAPWVIPVIQYAGAAFLLCYGFMSFRRAFRASTMNEAPPPKRSGVIITILALTWLNPHVYLDTVLLLGSLANAKGPDLAWIFAAGAIAGSTIWFLALGYGARLLAPLFAKPRAWQVIDVLIGVTMWAIAATLLFSPAKT